jgi:hypothetical protein
VTCRRLTEATYCQHYALSYQKPKTCSPSLKHRLVSSLPKSSGSSRTWNATSASLRCTSPKAAVESGHLHGTGQDSCQFPGSRQIRPVRRGEIHSPCTCGELPLVKAGERCWYRLV